MANNTCPPCNHNCRQGRDCPARKKTMPAPAARPLPADVAGLVANAERLARYDWPDWTDADIDDALEIILAFPTQARQNADLTDRAEVAEARELAAVTAERIEEPSGLGAFVGDIWFGHPVKRTMGTHKWDGSAWVALPSEVEALMGLLADARARAEKAEADARARAEKAEAEVARLRGALEWYADETNYDMHFVPRECGCCTDDDIPTELDRGERARTALTPKGADHD